VLVARTFFSYAKRIEWEIRIVNRSMTEIKATLNNINSLAQRSDYRAEYGWRDTLALGYTKPERPQAARGKKSKP
jgi:hypothetical protein